MKLTGDSGRITLPRQVLAYNTPAEGQAIVDDPAFKHFQLSWEMIGEPKVQQNGVILWKGRFQDPRLVNPYQEDEGFNNWKSDLRFLQELVDGYVQWAIVGPNHTHDMTQGEFNVSIVPNHKQMKGLLKDLQAYFDVPGAKVKGHRLYLPPRHEVPQNILHDWFKERGYSPEELNHGGTDVLPR